MNKKGFTLVEMLAVVTLISLLTVGTYYGLIRLKDNADKKNEGNIKAAILTGAKAYFSDNIGINTVSVSELKNKGYVDLSSKDDSKYNYSSLIVEKSYCDGTVKTKIWFNIENTEYNDCSCEVSISEASKESKTGVCTVEKTNNDTDGEVNDSEILIDTELHDSSDR